MKDQGLQQLSDLKENLGQYFSLISKPNADQIEKIKQNQKDQLKKIYQTFVLPETQDFGQASEIHVFKECLEELLVSNKKISGIADVNVKFNNNQLNIYSEKSFSPPESTKDRKYLSNKLLVTAIAITDAFDKQYPFKKNGNIQLLTQEQKDIIQPFLNQVAKQFLKAERQINNRSILNKLKKYFARKLGIKVKDDIVIENFEKKMLKFAETTLDTKDKEGFETAIKNAHNPSTVNNHESVYISKLNDSENSYVIRQEYSANSADESASKDKFTRIAVCEINGNDILIDNKFELIEKPQLKVLEGGTYDSTNLDFSGTIGDIASQIQKDQESKNVYLYSNDDINRSNIKSLSSQNIDNINNDNLNSTEYYQNNKYPLIIGQELSKVEESLISKQSPGIINALKEIDVIRIKVLEQNQSLQDTGQKAISMVSSIIKQSPTNIHPLQKQEHPQATQQHSQRR